MTRSRLLLFTFLSLAFVLFLSAGGPGSGSGFRPEPGENALRIPELIDTRETPEIELVLQRGAHEFYNGVPSDTMGFSADYLGPAIRLYRDTDPTITFTNQIGEPTTVHGHGLHVTGQIDGGPQSVIMPGESWEITIPVRQEAGTSGFHPHQMRKTGHHVHAGLAGLYLIEDRNSQALDLPKEYGVNDVPLIVQDRSFTNGRMEPYAVSVEQAIDGLRENTIVVNGTVNPYHVVPQGWVRLRLLNASNARFYRFALADGAPFFKIATEGGFINEPVEMESIEMSPGERNEIMVDLSAVTNATLVAGLLPADPEDRDRRRQSDPVVSIVELRVDPALQASGTLPETLNDIEFFDREDATNVRTISLDMEVRGEPRLDENGEPNMNMFGINGQPMDMSRMNFRVNRGEVEIWRITGARMPHPFHMHGASFQILSQNGEPPSEADRGWKDTVVVGREVTEIILRFDHEATDEYPYMMHCHILEHEEFGMMGQFTVL